MVFKLWDYINANDLQNPADKRVIIADASLRPIFGAERVTMFELAGEGDRPAPDGGVTL